MSLIKTNSNVRSLVNNDRLLQKNLLNVLYEIILVYLFMIVRKCLDFSKRLFLIAKNLTNMLLEWICLLRH